MNQAREPCDWLGAELAPGVLAISPILARHVHDTWVRMRLAQGWTAGSHRYDEKKQHPCLVPYDHLPDDEKESDRQTTLATLRGLVALGFEIRSAPR